MQKAYGRTLDVKLVMSGWEMVLADKYNADQVCYALKEYALGKEDFPTPASINNILNPAKPKITQAEYVAAREWQKTNNRYDKFTDAYDIIKGFEKQESQEREDYTVNQSMFDVARNSIKRIES